MGIGRPPLRGIQAFSLAPSKEEWLYHHKTNTMILLSAFETSTPSRVWHYSHLWEQRVITPRVPI